MTQAPGPDPDQWGDGRLLSTPSWSSMRTICKLRTGPRAWNTNSTQLTWTTPYTAGTG